MDTTVELPLELTRFELPEAVRGRPQSLLDRQDDGDELTPAERREGEALVDLAEILSLLRLRASWVTPAM